MAWVTMSVLTVWLTLAGVGAPAPNPAIDEAMAALMEEQEIVGLAVGVVRGGEVEHLAGYGHADREAGVPVDPNRTVFRWASISKPVTAIVATRLLRDGVLDLGDRVRDRWASYRAPRTYLVACERRQKTVAVDGEELACVDGFAEAAVPASARRITLEQLLTHTSGLVGLQSPRGRVAPRAADLNSPETNRGLEWGLRRLLSKPLMALPGAAYTYSTYGYNLAAVVMEKATGRAFPDLARELVAEPAGLGTLRPDYEWVDIPDRSVGYRKQRKGRRQIEPARSWDVSWKMAGGGLCSTPADLARFCAALMGDALLDDAEKAMLWTERTTADGEPTGYGMGFAVSVKGGRRVVEHAGVQPKARTRLRLYPDEDLCVIVMANTATAKSGAIADAVEAALGQ